MNKFLRKGANAQRNSGGTTLFAPLRLCVRLTIVIALLSVTTRAQANDYLFNDSHFHLTNYIQEGIDIHDFLKIMGNKVRSWEQLNLKNGSANSGGLK